MTIDLRDRPTDSSALSIIPMHMTIIFGSMLGGGRLALVLFGGLKTLADVAMHKVEHRMLQKSRGASR